MTKAGTIHLFFTFLALMASCTKAPEFPTQPAIEFLRLNKDTIPQGSASAPFDTLEVVFGFADGDADLGFERDTFDVFLTDSRQGFVSNYRLPVIPELGSGNGISGEIRLRIPNQPRGICCIYGPNACVANPAYPIDTFSFTIQLRDRAGNFSNKVQTQTIHILCN